MFCRKCGTKLRDGIFFCPNCGTKIVAGAVGTPAKPAQTIPPAVVSQPAASSKKKPGGKLIAGIFGGVLVLGVIVGVAVFLKSRESDMAIKEDDDRESVALTERIETQEPEADSETEEVFRDSEADSGTENMSGSEAVWEEDTAIHTYELIVADVTWTEAYYDCINRGGYLVRINTEEEFNVISSQIRAKDMKNITFWIGANRLPGSNQYHWIYENGTYSEEVLNNDFMYVSFWLDGEPSFTGAGDDGNMLEENCIDMFYRSSEDRFYWNDAPDDIISAASYYAGKIGYICEYDGNVD